jgi:hypothetical protein
MDYAELSAFLFALFQKSVQRGKDDCVNISPRRFALTSGIHERRGNVYEKYYQICLSLHSSAVVQKQTRQFRDGSE